MQKFKYNLTNRPYFATHFFLNATAKYKGKNVIGEYYAHIKNSGLSTTLVEEESFAEPGLYFLNLIETQDVFTDFLFDLAMKLSSLGDKLQQIYSNDLMNNTVSDLSDFYPTYSEIFPIAIGLGYSLDYAFDYYIKTNKIDATKIMSAGFSFLTKEKQELKKIFSIKDEMEQSRQIKEHVYKYGWILNDYTGEHLADVRYFMDRQIELSSFEFNSEDHLILKPKDMGEWMSFMIYARDERKRVNLMVNGLLDRYLRKECSVRKIDYNDAVMLTVDEFEKCKADPSKIEHYSERYFKLTKNGPVNILKEEWIRVSDENLEINSEIHGQAASRGKIRGIARVIMSSSDFGKMKTGEIIIASMTRPEYAPILSMAGAIITDEGGITCHAAIISRELRIPCIIGTKNATKILKDGDLVEVDADKGVVRIIK